MSGVACSSRTGRRLLFVILGLGLLIRLPGIFGQGWPQGYYPDENICIQRALYFGAEHTANPGWFNKPALSYYLLFGAYGAWYVGGRALGVFQTAEDFGVKALYDVGPFLLIGRCISVILGVATIWLAYLLGKQLRSRAVGVGAALALALMMAHVASSQVVKEDVACAFFHTASTIALVRVLATSRRKDLVRAGVLGGLGMATKYYSASLLIPAAFAHLFSRAEIRSRRTRLQSLAAAALFPIAFVVGFFIGSPYNFISPAFWQFQVLPGLKRLAHLLGLDALLSPGAIGWNDGGFVNAADSALGLMGRVLLALGGKDGVGVVFAALAAVGLGVGLRRRDRRDGFLVVAIFGQLLFIALSGAQYAQPRHLIVVLPLLACWIAEGALAVAGIWARVRPRFACARSVAGMLGVMGLATMVPTWEPAIAASLLQRNADATAADPRNAALRWFETHVPEGSVVLNYQEVLPLVTNVDRCRWALRELDRTRVATADSFQQSYPRLWALRREVGKRSARPTYDVIALPAPFGTEDFREIERQHGGRNFLWGWEPITLPKTVAPVVRYTDRPVELDAWLKTPASSRSVGPGSRAVVPETNPKRPTQLEDLWPASRVLVDLRPVAWIVCARISYENFEKPAKRSGFPNHAAFFDDLKSHYDCFQWSSLSGNAEQTIRVYNVASRVVGRAPRIVEMPLTSL